MKRIFSFLLFVCICLTAKAQVAYLDTSFNATGILALNHSGGADRPGVSLTRPNGKSLVIGYAYYDTRFPAVTLATVSVAQFDLNGKPDPAFGQNGIVVLDHLKTDANATDAILLPDGKLLITGKYLNAYSGPHHFVARLNEDGSLDTGFGVNGIAGHPDPDLVAWGSSLAIQPDGKIVMGGSKFTFIPPGSGYFDLALIRFLPDGLVDSSFGTNGVVANTLSSDALAVAVDADGLIYAGGTGNLLVRYQQNGSPDSLFGESGMVFVPDYGGVSHILIQPNGKIIAAGAKKDSDYKGFIYRFNTDGSLDPTFEDSGITIWERLAGIATDPDGKLVIGTFDDLNLRVFRYLPEGYLDVDFDNSIPLPPQYNFYTGVSLQPDGKVLLGGSQQDEFLFQDFCLARLTATLETDSAYGQNGILTHNFGTNHSGANAILIDDQNRIVVGGEATYVDRTTIVNLPTVHSVGFVSRFKPNGSPDSTFSRDGFTAAPQDPAILSLIARQPDGKILFAGGSELTFSYSSFGVKRLLPDGTPDSVFGLFGNGFTEQYLDLVYEAYASAVALGPDGGITVMGKVIDSESKRKIALVRFDSLGWPDPLFGMNGLVYSEAIPGNFDVTAGLIQPDGKILVAGTYPSPVLNIFLLRFLPDGTPDNTFGAAGVVLKPFTGQNYRLMGLALQPNGQILLCGNQGGVNLIVGRLNPDGSKDNTFSGDGLAVVNTGAVESGNALAVASNGRIVVAGWSSVTSNTANADPLLLRLLPDGTPDSSFAGNGYVITDLSGGSVLNALAIQANGNYVTAGFSNNDYLVVRYLSKLNVGLLDEPTSPSALLVYPNPVKGLVTFEYSLAVPSRVSLELFDVQGKRCHSFMQAENRPEGDNTETLLFPQSLVPGVYFLRVQTGLGSRSVRVLVE